MNLEGEGRRERERTCARFREVREMDGLVVMFLLWVGEDSEETCMCGKLQSEGEGSALRFFDFEI